MKVVLINSVCGVGSTGRICADLAAALHRNGHEAKVAYGRKCQIPDDLFKDSWRIGTDLDVKQHALASRIFDNQGFGSNKATQRFIEKLHDYDPDLIHLHNIHGYYLNVEILFDYLKQCGKPIVWTLHDCWAFTGHCVYFDYVGCDKWKKGCCDCPQKTTYPASFVMDRSKNNYSKKKMMFCGVDKLTLVTPSSWLEGIVKQSFLREYPVKVVHNTVDTQVFKPTPSTLRQQYGLENKKIVLGVSMGWPAHKPLRYLLQLADDLGTAYQVVLIGLNKKQIAGLPQNVMGLERTASVTELAAWYTAADVYANSTMEDNYPTVNLEAQACGTPVVTFRSGGSAEGIMEEYGIAVERGNREQFRRAVILACEMKSKKQPPVLPGKDDFTDRYLDLYNSLLGDRKPNPLQ